MVPSLRNGELCWAYRKNICEGTSCCPNNTFNRSAKPQYACYYSSIIKQPSVWWSRQQRWVHCLAFHRKKSSHRVSVGAFTWFWRNWVCDDGECGALWVIQEVRLTSGLFLLLGVTNRCLTTSCVLWEGKMLPLSATPLCLYAVCVPTIHPRPYRQPAASSGNTPWPNPPPPPTTTPGLARWRLL